MIKCSECKYQTEDETCCAFECYGFECPKLPCEINEEECLKENTDNEQSFSCC